MTDEEWRERCHEFDREVWKNVFTAIVITKIISEPNPEFTVENIRKAVEKYRNSNA